MSPLPLVTVSIVSHGQAALAQHLLQDLNAHCHASIAKVLLTLNIPESQILDTSGCRFPVEIIHNPTPLGFGANHNQAFARCESNWFLVLNPDVRLDFDVLSALLQRAEPHSGLLAPQELSATGHPQNDLRGPITPLELLRRRLFKRPPPPMRNGWVKGMFMLVRAEAWQQVRGFDERYFMYCEDFDLCARLMLAGWTVDFHPDISVTHEWHRSSSKSFAALLWHLSSLWTMWCSTAFWRYWVMVKNRAEPSHHQRL